MSLDLNQYLKLTVSSDKMMATVTITKEFPEDYSLTDEQLEKFMKSHGITYGFKKEVITQLLQDEKAIAAEGKRPIDGDDAYLEIVYNEEDKNDKEEATVVDFKDVLQIPSVKNGDVIAKKIPATNGTPGIDVYGEQVEAKRGRDFKLRAGKNTKIDEDKGLLYATIDGQLSVHKTIVHVLPTFEVHGDVSLKTGNIDFIGNVIIYGSIPPGFEVKAGGDIHVKGTVEAATLKAGGSIMIAAGIVGQEKSYVEAGGDVKTTFINQGHVNAGGDIIVGQTIFHSTLKARGKVICTEGKGLIVGGSTSSLKSIEANEFGNSMQTNTSLYIGLFQDDHKQKMELEKEHQKAKDELVKIGKLLKALIEKEKKKTITQKELEIKRKAQQSFIRTKDSIDDMEEKLEQLQEHVEVEKGFIKARNVTHPNVYVQFGKYRRKLSSTYHKAYISLVDGEIVVKTS